ncbi:hypothetical protein BC830DRAFT_1104467 [Chytriomyces sp. MP71]|nr:hypothetical protein BC830DRAFT_1104467 [Chytriomyces sp. MP71]
MNDIVSAVADVTPTAENSEATKSSEELLARLKEIRERLLSLRRGPGSSSKEMNRLWRETSNIVRTLASARSTSEAANSAQDAPGESSDSVIEDIVPMFFQFWSLRGKVSENMYPVYVKLAKSKHTLEQLLETGLFTRALLKDLETHIESAEHQMQNFKSTRPSTAGRKSVASTSSSSGKILDARYSLLDAKLTSCKELLHNLKEALNAISPFLLPIHTRLVEIKNDLQQLLARRSAHAFSLAEVQMLQDELLEIDSARIDGSYLGKDGTVLPGQATVIWLLEQCYEDSHELLALREAIDGDNALRPIYESLIRLKTKLEQLEIVNRYTFRCDELVPIQMELGKIDNLRIDGKFVANDADGHSVIPEGQAVLHFLLHKCYRLVHKIQSMTEPVSESLMPIYNQLMTLRKCFLELQRWKVKLSMRDITMYQMKLSMLDNKRVDGKFIADDGEIPEGQGILHDLLDECYQLQVELQHAAEEDDGDDDFEDEEGEEEEDC